MRQHQARAALAAALAAAICDRLTYAPSRSAYLSADSFSITCMTLISLLASPLLTEIMSMRECQGGPGAHHKQSCLVLWKCAFNPSYVISCDDSHVAVINAALYRLGCATLLFMFVLMSTREGSRATCVSDAALQCVFYTIVAIWYTRRCDNECNTTASRESVIRLCVAAYAYLSQRASLSGYMHCDASSRAVDFPVEVGHSSVQIETGCTYCDAYTAAVTVFAGTVGGSVASRILISPIGISPYASSHMMLAALVQCACCTVVFYRSSLARTDMGLPLYGDGSATSAAAYGMRRFMSTNSTVGMLLYTGILGVMCSILMFNNYSVTCAAKKPPDFIRKDLYHKAAFASLCVLLYVCTHIVFDDYRIYTEVGFLCNLSGAAVYFFGEACLPNYTMDSISHVLCGLLLSAIGLGTEVVGGLVEFTTMNESWMRSAQWGFFTNWSCFYLLLLLSMQCVLYLWTLCMATSSDRLNKCRQSISYTGFSISLCLFCCACALLPTDDGSLRVTYRSSMQRFASAFIHKHYIQIWPWIATVLTEYRLRRAAAAAAKGSSGQAVNETPCVDKEDVWLRCINGDDILKLCVLGPFLPLLGWLLTMSYHEAVSYPDDYPSLATPRTFIGVGGSGILLWLSTMPIVYD